jgi:hypothetical protein
VTAKQKGKAVSSSLSRYALRSCVVVAMLAGCGGSQPPIGAPGAMPQSLTESPEYTRSGPLLYVVEYGFGGSVLIYDARAKDPSPKASISEGLNNPVGDCLGGQGTLYVTNQPSGSGGSISEYAAGKIKPAKAITKVASAQRTAPWIVRATFG